MKIFGQTDAQFAAANRRWDDKRAEDCADIGGDETPWMKRISGSESTGTDFSIRLSEVPRKIKRTETGAIDICAFVRDNG